MNILFLCRKPPYGSAIAQEILDAILVAGVFEQAVSVLFMDDGVYQLLVGQRGATLGTRDIAKALTALPTYDVDQIFVASESLANRGLAREQLVLPAQPLDADGIAALIARHETVISG
jgi:tRNA 2-thiouridine synthesizing protein C